MAETDDYVSEFKQLGIPCIKTKRQILDELRQPCSRFAFGADKVHSDLRAAERAAHIDPLSDQELMIATDIPANWQAFLNYLHNESVTISPNIMPLPVRNDMPKIQSFILPSKHTSETSDGNKVDCIGFGTSYADPELAMSKAIGEVLERYFSSLYRMKDIRVAPYEEMRRRRFGPRPLDIFSLNGFLPWQEKRWPKFHKDSNMPIGWVRAANVTRGTQAYVPAQLVYWSYSADETVFADLNTNGCAGHFTKEEATLAAVLELIQRDGFMIHWLANHAPDQIDQTTLTDEDTLELLRRLASSKVSVYLLDITTDIAVPTCMSVVIDERPGSSALYVAAANGFTPRDAIFSALLEVISVYNAQIFDPGVLELDPDYKPFMQPINHLERLRVWHSRDMLDKFRFFLKGRKITQTEFMRDVEQYDTIENRLTYVHEQMHSLGHLYDVYLYEFKHRILDVCGFHVVRAIVPALVSMYLFENKAPLAAGRLTSVPEKLGWRVSGDFNPWPHPFP